MRHTTLTALLIVATVMPVSAATVWKWRDANGVIHFSDQPVAGAERVEISNPSVIRFDTPSSSTSTTAASRSAATQYDVRITSPANEETFPNAFQVSVGIGVTPGLAQGDGLVLYVDGQRVDMSPQATSYTINEISRGEHTVAAAVVNAQGSELRRSDSVRFYVTQPSVARPR